jgi:hypothetical protein
MARSKTGGRKAGTPNKKTVERELVEATAVTRMEALLKAAGIELSNVMPLEYALAVLRHPDSTSEERRWACEKALPFCHAKPTPDLPLQPTVAINGPAEVRLVIIDNAEQSRHRSPARLLSSPPAGNA